ncbi:MAG: creatininase family protein, partial [Firmicutes bacterium]|nr:creatininase family protein [Bacillota bacterium]
MGIREWETLYEVKGPKSLMEMTAVELKEAMKDCDTVILSFGAIENHGYPLPLGTDYFQANTLIR